MYEFTYRRPSSLDEARAMLAGSEGSRALSGGQTLMPVLRARLAMPNALVDLARIEELRGVSMEGDRIVFVRDHPCRSRGQRHCETALPCACGAGWRDR